MGKKRFIDPTQASTFQIVHRSQRDVRIADEEASSLVLRPIPPSLNILKKNKFNGQFVVAEEELEPEDDTFVYNGFSKQEDASNYGVYFKDMDDYDYNKHLKTIDDSRFVPLKTLPECVFASEETAVGLLIQSVTDYDCTCF